MYLLKFKQSDQRVTVQNLNYEKSVRLPNIISQNMGEADKVNVETY